MLTPASQAERPLCKALLRQRLADHRDLDRRRILPRMVHGVTRDDTLRLVVISSTRIQVAIEAREVAARDFDANAMSGFKVIARHHRPERYLVHLSALHPHFRFVVPVAIPHALNGLIEVVSATIRIDVDQFDCEVRVLRVRRHEERHFDWSTYFETFLQRLRTVNEDIRTRLSLPLIESARCDRVSCAANVATVRRHWIHWIVVK